MTHDPLCPVSLVTPPIVDVDYETGTEWILHEGKVLCHCESYAKVRADEREQAVQRVTDVEDTIMGLGWKFSSDYFYDDVVAAIRGEQQ